MQSRVYTLSATFLLWTALATVPARPAHAATRMEPHCFVPLRPGHWRTSGGNDFWIQCVGTEVFWLGMNSGSDTARRGAKWTQVGHGTIQGDLITLRWSDVPYGTIRTEGTIQLRVRADSVLRVVRDDGPVGRPEIRWVADK